MSKRNKQWIAAGLCAVLLLNTVSMAYASSAAADYEKTENVYARLQADGSVHEAYVVNHFDVEKAGTITDFGHYAELTNLTTTDTLTQKNGSVNFSADTGNFYYQGNIPNAALPWDFQITYQLDGVPITAQELGGKSGELRIRFRAAANPLADPIFSENYVMQVSLTLDNDVCSHVQAQGSTMADAGDGVQLTFTVLPGEDADFTVAASVKDFTMSGFSIAAVPYSISIDTDSLGMDDFTDQLSELTDAVEELNKGTAELKDGIRDLNDGSDDLLDGSTKIKKGLASLGEQGSVISDAAGKIGSALTALSSSLSDADFSALSGLAALPDGLTAMADGLDRTKTALLELRQAFSQSYSVMDDTLSAEIPLLTEAEQAALQNACANDSHAASACQKLVAAYAQLQKAAGIWSSVRPAFTAIITALDGESSESIPSGLTQTVNGLREMAKALAPDETEDTGTESPDEEVDLGQMMTQLQTGLAALAANYTDFQTGLTAYTDGVGELSKSYRSFHSGLYDLTDGIGQLKDGAGELSDGMNEFADGVSDMPAQVQDTIDEMLEKYNSADFDAVSFVDSRNDHIRSVQFVISTDGIDLPDVQALPTETVQMGFWDRLLSLFGLK